MQYEDPDRKASRWTFIVFVSICIFGCALHFTHKVAEIQHYPNFLALIITFALLLLSLVIYDVWDLRRFKKD